MIEPQQLRHAMAVLDDLDNHPPDECAKACIVSGEWALIARREQLRRIDFDLWLLDYMSDRRLKTAVRRKYLAQRRSLEAEVEQIKQAMIESGWRDDG